MNPSSSAFEYQQIEILKSEIDSINHDLNTLDNFQNKEKQTLFRLKLAGLREYRFMKSILAPTENPAKKADAKTPTPDIPEVPATWRDDILAFTREALNTDLFDHQKKLCLSRQRVNILIAGRGAGKSVAARVIALHHACTRPHHTVLVVSSGQRMSSDFGVKLLDLIRETPIRSWAASISHEQVKFHNGSTIKFLPANPDTIRGYHPKTTRIRSGMTVILDEACFMESGDEIRKAVEYALITTPKGSGYLYIVSSPSTVGSWVHDYVLHAADPAADVAVFHCPSSANPTIPPEEITRLRAAKNELEYRAEVLGEWVEGAYGLFSGLIDSNRIDASSRPLPPEILCTLGIDLALSFSPTHDRNALAVVAQWFPSGREDELEAHYRVLEMLILDRASDRELRSTVKRLSEKYPLAGAVVEQYQGKSLAEYTQALRIETQLVAPTSGLQQTVFHELHRLLRQGLLELPDGLPELFFEELKAFEYRREPNGHVTFGHPASDKFHDDTVYALAWAIHASDLLRSHPPASSIPPLLEFIPA